jgi:site-specific DNA recombinase
MKRASNRSRDASTEGAAPTPQIMRCGIYGRVSTDEQAVLEYNSLQAQEDICKNYITIRAIDPALQRKWTHVESYFDKGYSGGRLDRPELQRLLSDVKGGKIEVVVAYKIDRISRSISQFYEIWNALGKYNVDFASATQEFNTSTSQGKLMLNLLLSFAQYERELIGERTRDKIAAARKRGLWSGGRPVLGYDIDRTRRVLVVNEHESRLVRDIFQIYLAKLSLLRALHVVREKEIRSKTWSSSRGKSYGGKVFDRVTLHALLRNPVYIGKVRHHDQLHDGQHEPIVDLATFEKVQELLSRNFRSRSSDAENVNGFLLKGLVKCAACSRAMSPNFAYSKGRRYLYYTCQTATRQGAGACPIRSVSAPALERLVVERISFLATNEAVIERIVRQAGAEAAAKLPFLREDRVRLDNERRHRRDDARRLVDAIAAGNSSPTLDARLKEEDQAILALDRQLADVQADIERLDRSLLTPAQVASALQDFVSVWDELSPDEQARLARLVISEIVYERRDKSEGQITWRFRALGPIKTEPVEGLGFDECQGRRGGRDSNPRPPA